MDITVCLRGILGPAVLPATFAATTVAASASPSVTATQTDTDAFDSLSASTNLLFNDFDSSLGTLTGVFATLNYSATVNDLALVTSGDDTAVGSPTPLTATATTTLCGTGLLAGLFAAGNVTTPGFVGYSWSRKCRWNPDRNEPYFFGLPVESADRPFWLYRRRRQHFAGSCRKWHAGRVCAVHRVYQQRWQRQRCCLDLL